MSSTISADQEQSLPFLFRRSTIILLFILFCAIWIGHLHSVSLTIPTDNIEQLIWVRSLEWGYYKHPPLPTWMLWPLVWLFGISSLATMLLGAFCTLTSLYLMWSVLKDIEGRAFALLAVLAALCVSYYNGRLYYYNHNICMMLWAACSAWLWLRILRAPRLLWWIGLGVVTGLGMLSKYQYALIGAAGALVYCRHKLWQHAVHRTGLIIALLIATLMFAPHLAWLLQQKQGPIQYAVSSSLGAHLSLGTRLSGTAMWVIDWLFNRCMPGLLLIGIYWWFARKRIATRDADRTTADIGSAGRLIVLLWGFFPMAVMALMGLFGGVDLQAHWSTAFAMWTIPAVMMLFRLVPPLQSDRDVAILLILPFVLIQAALLLLSYETSAYGCCARTVGTWRQFPSRAMAQALMKAVPEESHRPIRIISGPYAASGAIALWLPNDPKILIDDNPAISPWIKPSDLAGQDVLQIWRPGEGPSNAHVLFNGWGWTVRRATDS